ncbi:MAG: FAD-dependent monooxygenase [Actinomycetota bacterium]|nr:FAD-dependent monooxygenase [Actinomycetota bacterium]
MAIVGGGIGGLTAALCLSRFGHRPVVIEQTAVLRPVGAGISLWPNGIKVLNLLGLGPRIEPLGGSMERMAYADRDGRPLLDFPLAELYDRVGEQARPLARADLQDLLLDEVRRAIGADQVLLGARADEVNEGDGGVTVRIGDGRTIEADVVVAADGTHSRLRDQVVGHPVTRRYVGYINWNGLMAEDTAIAPTGWWLTWVGGGRRASVMPVGGGRCYWFFDVPMPLEAVDSLGDHRDELATHFAGWAGPVQHLIEQVDAASTARIPIHDVDPLATWIRGRMALLGDAAHSMAPDLGQGGCQAIEDSWVLAHHLTATSMGVEDALARYQAERLPHTADMVRRARNRCRLTHGADPAATEAWYRSLATDGHVGIVDGLAQSVETGPCR